MNSEPVRVQGKGIQKSEVKVVPKYEYVYVDENGHEVKASPADIKGAQIVDDSKKNRK